MPSSPRRRVNSREWTLVIDLPSCAKYTHDTPKSSAVKNYVWKRIFPVDRTTAMEPLVSSANHESRLGQRAFSAFSIQDCVRRAVC